MPQPNTAVDTKPFTVTVTRTAIVRSSTGKPALEIEIADGQAKLTLA